MSEKARGSAVTRPNPGAVQATRESLGLSTEDLGTALGVRHDTVRRWESGRDQIPVRVGEELAELAAYTKSEVGYLVDQVFLRGCYSMVVWRDTAAFHRAWPEYAERRLPARWWRHVVVQAQRIVAARKGHLTVASPGGPEVIEAAVIAYRQCRSFSAYDPGSWNTSSAGGACVGAWLLFHANLPDRSRGHVQAVSDALGVDLAVSEWLNGSVESHEELRRWELWIDNRDAATAEVAASD